jgi:hypothetical protein
MNGTAAFGWRPRERHGAAGGKQPSFGMSKRRGTGEPLLAATRGRLAEPPATDSHLTS